jgi:ABC-type bacteriocin/lantibiotic exporter with double-glycine peptidase domain
MHHGNIPKDAEAAWRKAMDTAQEREKERRKETAICGAECLKEMINRLGAGNAGQAPDVQALAKEMKTTDEGSSMADLAATARRHGLKATGLALTQKGLEEQALPLVSLMSPGHYVIVEQVTKDKVSIWDPDGAGQGKGARRTLPLQEWKMMWRGVGMTLTRGS